jgi:glutathione S-transferase
MGFEVYCDPCTINSRKVLAGLDQMKCDYKFNFINYFEGGQKDPEFVKNINPSATVPAATDGDLHLTESNAILMYGADKADSSMYPKDLKQRASVNRWLLWEASVWFGSCYIYVIQNVVQELLGGKPDQSVLDSESGKWNNLAGILNNQLGKTKWIAGDELTIADIAIAAPMHLWAPSKMPVDKHPNLKRWIEEVEKLPAWQKTQGAVDKALLPNRKSEWKSNQVRATFNYTKDLSDKLTELYFFESEKAQGIHEPGDDAYEMPVYDGWDQASKFSEDVHGFSIHDFDSKYPTDKWEDDELVREKFYPEVVEFLKKAVGAKRVLVFDHTIRTAKNAQKKLTQETKTSQRAPVSLVHCDYTAESGPVRVRQLLQDEAEDLLSRRVAFLNVWKPLNKVEENPLAMCDVQSSPNEDFFKLYLRYRERTGENYVMRHNPQHKWYYFPDMDSSKVILLKTYDSDKDRARFVGHSAFKDPTSPPDAAIRESVEIRTIAFF